MTPAELRDLAVELAERAGRELLRRHGNPTSVGTKSSATDPVSEADRAAEDLVVAGLRAARPHDGIEGEEGTDEVGASGLRWVVDPLDGTVNYLYGIPGWAVSIACEDSAAGVPGRALVGVVHDPWHGETFSAIRGEGAWLEGQRLAVRRVTALDAALVATGFSYDASHRAEQAEVVRRVLPAVRDIRRVGAAALDLAWVAAGRLDAYYENSTSHWDWAAGALLAAEAGARVTTLAGAGGRSGVVAAPPAIHEALRVLVDHA